MTITGNMRISALGFLFFKFDKKKLFLPISTVSADYTESKCGVLTRVYCVDAIGLTFQYDSILGHGTAKV